MGANFKAGELKGSNLNDFKVQFKVAILSALLSRCDNPKLTIHTSGFHVLTWRVRKGQARSYRSGKDMQVQARRQRTQTQEVAA